jgi:excisionase family DNA binding protein
MNHRSTRRFWFSLGSPPIFETMRNNALDLLSAKEAAPVLRCSIPSLRRLARSGGLRHIRFSRRLFFRLCDLQDFVEAHVSGTKGASE